MVELTTEVPKPMLEVNGKTLLEYKFDALPDDVTEIIIVVGYLGSVIQRRFGGEYKGKKILYVEQPELNGTAGALWCAKDILKDRFFIMAGDDIYAREDLEACLEGNKNWKMVVQQIGALHRAGSVILGEDGNISEIIESSKEDEGRLQPGIASTSLFLVDTRLFECEMVPKHETSNEYGHPQTIVAAAKKLGIPLEPVFSDKWIQITAPKDLVAAAEILKKMEA